MNVVDLYRRLKLYIVRHRCAEATPKVIKLENLTLLYYIIALITIVIVNASKLIMYVFVEFVI